MVSWCTVFPQFDLFNCVSNFWRKLKMWNQNFVTVSATLFIISWAWSRSTAIFCQALVIPRSQLCILKGEQLLTTSSTAQDAASTLVKEVGGGAIKIRGQILLLLFTSYVGFFSPRFSWFYERRLEAYWVSVPPLRGSLVVTKWPSQRHDALWSSQPSCQIPDGAKYCLSGRHERRCEYFCCLLFNYCFQGILALFLVKDHQFWRENFFHFVPQNQDRGIYVNAASSVKIIATKTLSVNWYL